MMQRQVMALIETTNDRQKFISRLSKVLKHTVDISWSGLVHKHIMKPD